MLMVVNDADDEMMVVVMVVMGLIVMVLVMMAMVLVMVMFLILLSKVASVSARVPLCNDEERELQCC